MTEFHIRPADVSGGLGRTEWVHYEGTSYWGVSKASDGTVRLRTGRIADSTYHFVDMPAEVIEELWKRSN